VATPTNVAVRGEHIRLGQFLKLADAVDQGSDVKALLATGSVKVNDKVETRRGRQLQLGDVVTVNRIGFIVSGPDTGADGGAQT